MGVVEKGNKIYVAASNLTNQEITVEWKQNLSVKSRQYYLVEFVNKDQGNEQSVLFIQKEYVDSLRNKKTSGDDYTVIVDDSFHYGRNPEKTKRWLVFHDKSANMYQWRFIRPALSKLGQDAANFAGGILKQYIGIDYSGPAGFIGETLRNF